METYNPHRAPLNFRKYCYKRPRDKPYQKRNRHETISVGLHKQVRDDGKPERHYGDGLVQTTMADLPTILKIRCDVVDDITREPSKEIPHAAGDVVARNQGSC